MKEHMSLDYILLRVSDCESGLAGLWMQMTRRRVSLVRQKKEKTKAKGLARFSRSMMLPRPPSEGDARDSRARPLPPHHPPRVCMKATPPSAPDCGRGDGHTCWPMR